MLNDALENSFFKARILAYGPPKSRKTWWSGRAAECGFNVICLDGDGEGFQILKQIPVESRKRIALVDIKSRPSQPVMHAFIGNFLKYKPFCWNETDKGFVRAPALVKPDCGHWVFDASRLSPNDVLVIDSWTAVIEALKLQAAMDLSIDLAEVTGMEDAKKSGEMRSIFGMSGSVADWMLSQIGGLNSHLIVIGHVQTYEKTKKEGKKEVVEWTRTQPISTSGIHSGKLAKYFGDVLFFSLDSSGNTRISTEPKADRDGGSRNLPPGIFSFDAGPNKVQLQFEDYCRMLSITTLDRGREYDSKAATYYPPGVMPDFYWLPNGGFGPNAGPTVQNAAGSTVSINTNMPPSKPSGLAALIGSGKK